MYKKEERGILMKKYISFLMFLLTLLMSSCDMPLNGTAYEVKFDSDGGTSVTTQTIQEGKKASTPIDPTKDGYTFVYWMYNGEEFDFSTLIYNDIVLVAKWAVNHLHNYTKTIVEPTCTDNGYTLLKCSCGYSYKTDFISWT